MIKSLLLELKDIKSNTNFNTEIVIQQDLSTILLGRGNQQGSQITNVSLDCKASGMNVLLPATPYYFVGFQAGEMLPISLDEQIANFELLIYFNGNISVATHPDLSNPDLWMSGNQPLKPYLDSRDLVHLKDGRLTRYSPESGLPIYSLRLESQVKYQVISNDISAIPSYDKNSNVRIASFSFPGKWGDEKLLSGTSVCISFNNGLKYEFNREGFSKKTGKKLTEILLPWISALDINDKASFKPHYERLKMYSGVLSK